MKEYNKKTLIEALSTLPEYEPPGNVWEEIRERMEKPESDLFHSTLLKRLPEYEPAPQVWKKITDELDGQGAKIFPLPWKKALSVAAAVSLILFAVWQWNQHTGIEPLAANLRYSTETVDTLLFTRDWGEDDEAFHEFLSLCESKKYVCQQPEFQLLQAELTELTEARLALEETIGKYSAEPDLIAQIKKIELERTDILKKMIVMLI